MGRDHRPLSPLHSAAAALHDLRQLENTVSGIKLVADGILDLSANGWGTEVCFGMEKGLWRKVDARSNANHTAPRSRALSKSMPARPYICRLTNFSFVFCPSVWPFDHGSMRAAFTAA
jgi:hypothetical protein